MGFATRLGSCTTLSLSLPPSLSLSLSVGEMGTQSRREGRLLLIFLFAFVIIVAGARGAPDLMTSNSAVQDYLCKGALYSDLCASALLTIPDLPLTPISNVISAFVKGIVPDVDAAKATCSSVRTSNPDLDSIDKHALDDCLELLSITADELTSTITDLSLTNSAGKQYHNMETLLSAAITNQHTCLDGFTGKNPSVRNPFKDSLTKISHHVSNSLVLLKKIKPLQRRGLKENRENNRFPAWMPRKERRLLETEVNETKVDIVVAKDGSGDFTTVQAAVDAANENSKNRFVIHIKVGVYEENVEVGKKKTMLMFLGDGINKTIIKGNRSVVGGWTTFRSATVAVVGNNFIAKGVTFINDAGASMHQAVALRSGADLSAFYKCSFEGYQDTLYVHSLRQFYRECDVYGTIDFIFGNAAAVFQNCTLYARKPDPNQKNIFTAQGREDPNQNTGISILNSRVTAAPDLVNETSHFSTYLGRPWKEYSRTVFMHSYIDDLVDPKGWLEWSGNFALKTLFYAEYMNTGTGSNVTNRVNWAGYRTFTRAEEANLFTVENFIEGGEWLAAAHVPFRVGFD